MALACVVLALGCRSPVSETPAEAAVEPEAEVTSLEKPASAEVPVVGCLEIERIIVEKSLRRLEAHCVGGAVVDWVVALGRERFGAKSAKNDMKTPEGEYRVVGAARPSRFHLFIPIDYPSLSDAERARQEGRIPAAEYRRILSAHKRGLAPPGDTVLGGGLGFHGEGEKWREISPDLDWTLGCVGMADSDIDFLAERLPLGTPVEIRP